MRRKSLFLHVSSLNKRLLPIKRKIVVIVGSVVFLCLRIANLLFKVRVGFLEYCRVGHLAANTELFLRRQAVREKRKKEIQIFITGKKVANRQLLTMFKRKLRIIDNAFVYYILSGTFGLFKYSSLWIELPFNSNEYYEFNNIPAQLSFTENEDKKGRDELHKIGIPAKAPFVCFHARDTAYLDRNHSQRSREEWSRQDYRDCNINNFLKAAEYLSTHEIYSLRMGETVLEEIFTNNPLIIDYSKRFRSDFGDIYLPAKCKFFLGCTAGLCLVSNISNVPVAYTNYIPLGILGFRKEDIVIYKKYWDIGKKRFLTFREIIRMGGDWNVKTPWFERMGIEAIENSSDEILALTKEMNQILDSTYVYTEEDEALQQRFRKLFPEGHRNWYSTARVGSEFLRQNRELLE